MKSEWDVLKAHARAQCVTAKDRMWCEMALALGEVVRRIAIRGEATPPMVRQAWYGVQPRKVQDVADALARAERKAAKAAKQAAREERKRMRRKAIAKDGSSDAAFKPAEWGLLRMMRWCAKAVAGIRFDACEPGFFGDPGGVYLVNLTDEQRSTLRKARRDTLAAYAIACAEAGAVPGGRVH